MANTILRNKEVDKTWAAVETLLKVDGSKTVTIPHRDYYNITTYGFSIAMVLQPGASFSLSKKTVGGYELTYASGSLTWTVYNATTSLSVSVATSSTYKNHVFPYITSAGYIGLKVINLNGETEAVSGSTITGDFSNSADMVISGTCLTGFILPLAAVPSSVEMRAMVNPCFGELAIVPTTLHPYTRAYWTCQDKTGNKAYDSIEQFNSAKPKLLPDLILTNWNKTANAAVSYLEGSGYIGATVSDNPRQVQIFTPSNVPVTAGISYTMVVDCELTISAPGNIDINFYRNQHFTNRINFNLAGRQRKTLVYTPAVGSNDQFYMEAMFYETGASFKVYECKLYPTAMGDQLTGNHATLNGYSAAELGTSDKTTQTARVDFYDKTTTNFWDGSGNEVRTGFPDLVNALLIDATHTVTFPLSGTVTISYKGYGVMAYHLKSGQTLTTLQTKWLENNLIFANPGPDIVAKLDAFYQLGVVNGGTLQIANLIDGTNPATVSSNYSTVTINSLR